MNYYIQGDEAKAEQIKAAFDKLGFDPAGWNCDGIHSVYFTVPDDNKVRIVHISIGKIIMTHPDYKELELPVQHKFKVGDWLVYNNGNCFAGGFSVAQVVKVKDGVYFFVSGTSGSFKFIDENCRLWTIEDAKDGDVITNGKLIVIFNKLEEPTYKQHIIAYVGLDLCGRLQITEDTWQLGVDKAMPATKEQRGLIFDKMKEAGYQWNPDKKELRKILPHYDIKNFKPFDKVLVRCADDEEWAIEMFSKYYDSEPTIHGRTYRFMCIADSYSQCIPFEGNEHLLGTTDPCDEQYINR